MNVARGAAGIVAALYQHRAWEIQVDTTELKILKVRDSSYSPSLLNSRRKAERALSVVVQGIYVQVISTRG